MRAGGARGSAGSGGGSGDGGLGRRGQLRRACAAAKDLWQRNCAELGDEWVHAGSHGQLDREGALLLAARAVVIARRLCPRQCLLRLRPTVLAPVPPAPAGAKRPRHVSEELVELPKGSREWRSNENLAIECRRPGSAA